MMKRLLVATAALAVVASTASYAQTTPAVLPPGVTADGSGIRQQLKDTLQKAGFTDVKVVPDAFIVQASNKAGEPVTMFISPDSLTVFTAEDVKGKAVATTDAAPATKPKP